MRVAVLTVAMRPARLSQHGRSSPTGGIPHTGQTVETGFPPWHSRGSLRGSQVRASRPPEMRALRTASGIWERVRQTTLPPSGRQMSMFRLFRV